MEQYIGLDVSLKDTAVSIREGGTRIWRGKCPSDPKLVAEVIRKRGPNGASRRPCCGRGSGYSDWQTAACMRLRPKQRKALPAETHRAAADADREDNPAPGKR